MKKLYSCAVMSKIFLILKWAILHDEYFWYFKYILMLLIQDTVVLLLLHKRTI